MKEPCGHCAGSINIGHTILECGICNNAIHTKCYKKAKFLKISNSWVCSKCQYDIELRYNPFSAWLDSYTDRHYDDDRDADATLQEISNILSNCKSYSIKELNKILSSDIQSPDQSLDEMLSSLFLNIDGNPTNFDQFTAEIKRIQHNFCAIGLAETNTDPNVSATFQIPGYKSYYQSIRDDKQSGTGVALYIHESINVSVVEEISECSTHIECLFVKTTNTSTPITFGVVYRPNDGDKDKFYEHLENIFDFLPQNGVYIMGDYNINLLSSEISNKFEECFLSAGYAPLISTYTHDRPGSKNSCIDNILTNNTQSIVLSGTLSDNLSHHLPIFQFSNIKVKTDTTKEKHVQYYEFSCKKLNKFVDDLSETVPGLKASENFTDFTNTFMTALDKNCKLENPKTTKRTQLNNPWITESIMDACEKKHELMKIWKKTVTKENPNGDPILYQTFSTYRKTLKHIVTSAKASYRCNQITENKEDRKKTWKIINELRGKSKQKIKPPFVIDNQKIMDRRIIANEFNKYFNSIASRLNESTADIRISDSKFQSFADYLGPPNKNSIVLFSCSSEEIMKIIAEFDNGKASDIPIRVIKKSSHIISPKLAEYFNKLMMCGIFPDVLKLGKVTPIYKKGNSELLENYRPISTLPIFGKIFEKIIYTRLYSFLTSQNILHKNQFGFRTSHSTSHALNYSVSHISSALKSGKHVLGIFIDLSKAFDTIDHDKLLYKLDKYGIRGI
ncbi:MAG: hypothetical protein HRU38_25700, partial [Saccharospirillaceae bacterium]|nr:hypothetical protein [Saccharospirillaceae bacterium]